MVHLRSIGCFLSLILVLITNTAISSPQEQKETEGKSFAEKQMEWAENFMGVWQNDPILVDLYKLTKAGQYEAVISKCKQLTHSKPEKREYYSFYVAAYYKSDKKDSAMAVFKNYIDAKKIGSFEMDDILIFNTFPCFYEIGREQSTYVYALSAYLDNYKKRNFPETTLGIKLIDLFFKDQLLRNISMLEQAHCTDSAALAGSKAKFLKDAEIGTKSFLEIYKTHPDYITESEVGKTVSKFQQTLTWHSDSTSRSLVLFPMLKKAMEQKQITPDEYVYQLLQDDYRRDDYQGGQLLQDSLCKVYGCKLTTVYSNQ